MVSKNKLKVLKVLSKVKDLSKTRVSEECHFNHYQTSIYLLELEKIGLTSSKIYNKAQYWRITEKGRRELKK